MTETEKQRTIVNDLDIALTRAAMGDPRLRVAGMAARLVAAALVLVAEEVAVFRAFYGAEHGIVTKEQTHDGS